MPTRTGGQKGFCAQKSHRVLGFTGEAPEGFSGTETPRKGTTKERRRCWVREQHEMGRRLSFFCSKASDNPDSGRIYQDSALGSARGPETPRYTPALPLAAWCPKERQIFLDHLRMHPLPLPFLSYAPSCHTAWP